MEPQGGRRRGWEGREERAESAVLVPASLQPRRAAEDAPAANRLRALSETEPCTHPTYGLPGGGGAGRG